MATAEGCGFEVDAAVNLEAERQGFLQTPLVELMHLGQRIVDKGLAAEAWPDGHDEDQLDLAEVRTGGISGSGGIEDDAATAAEFPNVPQGRGDGKLRFDMDGNEVAAGFGKGFDMLVRVVEHEVGIEEKAGSAVAQVGDRLRAEGKIGDEVTVHDIEVKPAQLLFADQLEAIGQRCVIGGEDGGGEQGRIAGTVVNHGV